MIMLNDHRGSIFDQKRIQEDLLAQAALALYRIAQGIEALVRRRGEALGLSRTGVQALLFLHSAHPSSRTIGSIARRLSVTPATASRLVDALERKGLIRRARLEEDRRAVRAELTEEGQEMIGRIADIGEELVRLVRVLPDGEREAFARDLMEILKAMQRAGYITASGTCRTCALFRADSYPDEERPHYCVLTGERLSEEESYLERLDWASNYIV